jgi:predicted dehydrogenase
MGLHIGIIGAGSVSYPHLRAFNRSSLVERVTVADLDPRALDRLSARQRVDGVVKDYRRLLADPTLNIIDICLPHHLHHPIALEAFQAGKDVLSEKPIALTLAHADEMMAAAESAGLRFYVSLNQLFLPAVERAGRLLAMGKIGKPFMAMITIVGSDRRMRDPTSWKGSWERAGGGVLVDTGMHPLYLLEHFFGPPLAVTANAQRLVVEAETKADDTAILVLEYANHVLASVALTYAAFGDQWREERHIHGTKGSLRIRDDASVPLLLVQQGRDQRIAVHPLGPPWQLSIQRSLDHFLDCYVNERDFRVAPTQARAALRTALAAYESAREGRRIPL